MRSQGLWAEVLGSRPFWSSFSKSLVINWAFGLSINAAQNSSKATIPMLAGLKGDISLALLNSAFFCGFLTPLLSSWFIGREVAGGHIRPPDAEKVTRSCLHRFLRMGIMARTVLIALGDILTFGLVSVALGWMVCGDAQDSCDVPVWAFLVILTVWIVPLQIVTSLLNYTATVHLSRHRHPEVGLVRSGISMEG
mmetsp:Transcript_133168/g.297119  ORF Transcript_133168/g.297119 Transcript_133168/m.297119 type:complete len:195 (+) Transcript_133168:39-623(+)|eukprot:CAMPEP_0180788318 /NCGR_PEP_ID=MMETSP1038_2-20121128/51925_1 /TAXON_ID=632150 /ORGANISM="Azadinium spinosum, Strain 3D9" /LENGTH=194 /DNA_ID=CAMNT_0022825809 /DNA_START=22 /DNA_END=606 /DNA_ORIENTATION=+